MKLEDGVGAVGVCLVKTLLFCLQATKKTPKTNFQNFIGGYIDKARLAVLHGCMVRTLAFAQNMHKQKHFISIEVKSCKSNGTYFIKTVHIFDTCETINILAKMQCVFPSRKSQKRRTSKARTDKFPWIYMCIALMNVCELKLVKWIAFRPLYREWL